MQIPLGVQSLKKDRLDLYLLHINVITSEKTFFKMLRNIGMPKKKRKQGVYDHNTLTRSSKYIKF